MVDRVIGQMTTGSGGGTTAAAGLVLLDDSGDLTGGNVEAIGGEWTPYGPDLSGPATAGDRLLLLISAQREATDNGIALFNAAIIVGGEVYRHWAHPNPADGGRPHWYVEGSRWVGPGGPEMLTLTAGDVDAGTVTIRPCVRGDGGTVTIRANTAFPGRTALFKSPAP